VRYNPSPTSGQTSCVLFPGGATKGRVWLTLDAQLRLSGWARVWPGSVRVGIGPQHEQTEPSSVSWTVGGSGQLVWPASFFSLTERGSSGPDWLPTGLFTVAETTEWSTSPE
jgi:hypothetical protein